MRAWRLDWIDKSQQVRNQFTPNLRVYVYHTTNKHECVQGRGCALAFRGSDDRLDWRNDYRARPLPLVLCSTSPSADEGDDEAGARFFLGGPLASGLGDRPGLRRCDRMLGVYTVRRPFPTHYSLTNIFRDIRTIPNPPPLRSTTDSTTPSASSRMAPRSKKTGALLLETGRATPPSPSSPGTAWEGPLSSLLGY